MILIAARAQILASGANYANRLGLGNGQWNLTQFTAQSGPNFDIVAPGDHHTLAISNGVAYCWGHNNRGKCGVPTSTSQVDTPKSISALSGITVVYAAAGQDHSVFLSDTGDVYTFGKNTSGYLGAPGASGEELKHPQFGERIVHIAASQSLTFAVGESGKVYAFGYCSYYRCGDELNGYMLSTPTVVKLGFLVQKVFLTVHGAYFAAYDGRSYVLGYNYFGELCYPSNQEGIATPVEVEAIHNIVKVTAGVQHAILLTSEYAVYGCGTHTHAVFGEYGVEAKKPYKMSISASDAAATETGTLLVQDGKLFRTGYSGYGEMNFYGYCYYLEDAGISASQVWCYADACFVKQ